MRILHIIDSAGFYGAETVLLHLMEEQRRQGLGPALASIGTVGAGEKDIEREARSRGLDVEPFRMRAGPNLRGIRQVLAYARRGGFDIVHSHGYKGNILLGLMPRRQRGFPMVTTVHGFTWTGGLSRMLAYQILDSISLLTIDRVVLVNPMMRDHPWLRCLGPGRFEVVRNGIPVASGTIRASLPPEMDEFVRRGSAIVSVGRLSEEKGTEFLLEAVASLVAEGRNLQLVLIGEGALRHRLEARAAALDISDRVMFAGYMPDAGSFLHRFDIFAMPSLTEGLPMVLLEAMLAGTAVVATRVGGIPEVLEDGNAGLLVEPRDPSAIRQGIASVLDDPELARARTVRAEERVRAEYSSATMANGYLRVYEGLVDG